MGTVESETGVLAKVEDLRGSEANCLPGLRNLDHAGVSKKHLEIRPGGNDLARQNEIDESVTEYQPGATWVWNEGYRAHSGLNAARNVGLKAIARYRTNPILEFPEKGKA